MDACIDCPFYDECSENPAYPCYLDAGPDQT